ncbi:MAG TPA: hypothetical protein VE078_16340, partial [Thermoanaerobaculia bacterium]|nr:hypothetical protein [Thermoanaerobaculia bacterium]
MNLFRRLSCVRPPALGIALLATAVVLAVPHLLPAASSGTTGLYMPQGNTAGTANGDYVSDTAGMNSLYRYFIEVPAGIARLQIDIFDADVGAGGAGESTAGRDRDRSGGFTTTTTYTLVDPGGTTRTPLFTTGTNAAPIGADNAWTSFYNMSGNTVRDNFGTDAYTNNDGTNNWSAAWAETDGGGGGATGGSIRVITGELRLQDIDSGTQQIQREADLLGSPGLGLVVAFLTFDFRTSNNLEDSDDVNVEISNNGGGSWTTLENFSNDSSGSRSYNITTSIANNTRVRFIVTGGYTDAAEFFFVDNVQITDGLKTAGHWELQVDMAAGNDINAIGIRAHDGTSGSGGTELNVYYDSQNQLGINPPASGTTTRSYELYPYVTSGCTASTNDFDYDSNRGDTGSMAFHSRTGTYNQSLASTDLSTDNVWDRTTITTWTSDTDALEYGIWNQDASITSYVVAGTPNGNYTTIYMGNFQVAANPPAANPTTNAFRVYLPTDANAAPVKPYVEQQVRHDSGPNPPAVGQSSDVTVTIRVVNPSAQAINFSASNLVTANVPLGGGAVYADASQISQGTLVSEPAMLGTGNITWNPGTLAAGATALLSYEVRVTPTSAGQRIPATATPASGNGTRATFVDETGNTTQTRATYTFGPLCELAVTQGLATHAVISSFQAFADEGGGVRVEWTTASEVGTAGFRLLRWDGAANTYRPVHEGLLPGLLRSPQGGGYHFLDETAAPNQVQRYLLEEVEVNGKRRSYGPYSVTPDWRRQDGPRLAIANQRANERGFAREEHPVVGRPRAEKDEAASQGELRSAQAFASAGSAGAHISIRESGLVYITREEVATWLGLSVDKAEKAIAKGSLSLTRAGQPVAWFPDGVTSGVGKKEDKPKSALGLYFYGETVDSLYSLDTVYRLREGSGPVMQTGTVAPSAATAAEISFPDTKPFEVEAFPATAINPDPESDYWFWNFIISGDPDLGKQTFAFDAPAIATGAGTLTLDLHGATDNSTPAEHQASVVLNGTTLGDTEWQGIAAHSATFPVPDGLLLATGNQLEITGTVGGGAPFSFYFIDGFKVGYPRRFTSAG